MLLVKTYLDSSTIQGLGLFAGEDISAGEMIWTFAPGFDRIYSCEEYDALPEPARIFIEKYGYWSNGKIFFTADFDRHTNHSDNPNTYMAESGDMIAKRDIRRGEEITSNYRDFDEKWEQKLKLK